MVAETLRLKGAFRNPKLHMTVLSEDFPYRETTANVPCYHILATGRALVLAQLRPLRSRAMLSAGASEFCTSLLAESMLSLVKTDAVPKVVLLIRQALQVRPGFLDALVVTNIMDI